ncbi:MAG TPA: T9SS type A sorting domain-containing protein [Bacteroidia bacterium]|nr:T9SS type A sorting domain-containing protein [Bacteroidia bacterium]
MKKNILFILVFGLSQALNARMVRFSVDMSSHTVSPNGVHLVGDFQALVGHGPDWDPGTLSMTPIGSGSIYQVVLNLPAFKKYEYLFVNGDLSYESEFVPEASRVGYNFVDNRWIYVDSLSNDTLNIGAIRFGENAPAGKVLLRYKIDMSDLGSSSANGVHVGTSYQATVFNPQQYRLYSFDGFVHEVIHYIDTAQIHQLSYIFYNGNTAGTTETVPSACQLNGKRSLTILRDTVLPQVCFSSCSACLTTGLKFSEAGLSSFKLFPNPMQDQFSIESTNLEKFELLILDPLGRCVFDQRYEGLKQNISPGHLSAGVYMLVIRTENGKAGARKLLVN